MSEYPSLLQAEEGSIYIYIFGVSFRSELYTRHLVLYG